MLRDEPKLTDYGQEDFGIKYFEFLPVEFSFIAYPDWLGVRDYWPDEYFMDEYFIVC